ncbi:hypothetical protein, partial [Brucella abortus]|uniref:hypothetical protein n=1 Tax=Brucella abortus TaxID=235 RepID=UPI0027DCB09F
GEFLLRLIDESKLHRLFGRKTVRWTVLSSASTLTKKLSHALISRVPAARSHFLDEGVLQRNLKISWHLSAAMFKASK